MLTNILAYIVITFGAILAFALPSLKNKNEELNKEIERKDNLISSIKNAEEIKVKNSKLSKSDLIRGLSSKD